MNPGHLYKLKENPNYIWHYWFYKPHNINMFSCYYKYSMIDSNEIINPESIIMHVEREWAQEVFLFGSKLMILKSPTNEFLEDWELVK